MARHRGEPPKETGEIPVSIDFLSKVNRVAIRYMSIKSAFYIAVGFTWIFYKSSLRINALEWLNYLTPTRVGYLFIVSGCVSLISSFWDSPRAKRLGFFLLILAPTSLGLFFFISWVLYLLPGTSIVGYDRAGISAISYWAYGASAYLMARVYSLSVGVSGLGVSK